MTAADAVDSMLAQAYLNDANATIADLRKENASLREQLRLAQEQAAITNDKMTEQVRQAIWNMADEALDDCDTLEHFIMRMRAVKDANAPKD